MINHHPAEATLLAYAVGELSEALAIVMATHIGQCAACQHSLATLEAIGGTLLDELSPMSLTSHHAVDRLLARLDNPPPAAPPVSNPDLPTPLDRLAFGRWWPIGIGIRYRPLLTAGTAWGGLILGEPGRQLPSHGHMGLELTCILSGAVADGAGEYHAGDLSEPVTDHDQPPIVTGREPCLCIIASEGMRFRGLLGVGQRFLERCRGPARRQSSSVLDPLRTNPGFKWPADVWRA